MNINIDKIKNRIKQAAPVFPEFDAEPYKEVATESVCYEDKPVSKSARIPVAFTGANGVFVFVNEASKDVEQAKKDTEIAKQRYGLNTNGTFTFVRTHEKDFFLNGTELVEIDSCAERFAALYENTLRPAIDLNYIRFDSEYDMLFEPELPDEYRDEDGKAVDVDETGEISYIASRISKPILDSIEKKLEDAKEDNSDAKEYVDENGIKYVKHFNSVGKGVISYSTTEVWYPVANEDPTRFFLLALFGGVFGLHKFKTREYLKGIFYLLTCGGFGIFYILDIISIATGNYFVEQIDYETESGKTNKTKTRIYLDKLPRISYRIAGTLGAILIAAVMYFGVYAHALGFINEALASSVERGVQTQVNSVEGQINSQIEDAVSGLE